MLLSKRILFITHETALSGAPRSLLYFIEWLKLKQKDCEIHVLALKSENPSSNSFKDVSDIYYDFTDVSNNIEYNLKNRISRNLLGRPYISEKDKLIETIIKNQYELIYANTIVSLPIALQIKVNITTSKLLLHVHELSTAIYQLLPDFVSLIGKVDFFIAASDLVQDHLVRYFGCEKSKIQRVYECTNVTITNSKPTIQPIKAKRVIMVGGAYWAKGDDVFLLVAKEVVTRNPMIHFYWLGSQSLERKTVNQGDVEKLGISSNVHFLPHTITPHDIVKQMDVFALTSRSDSFPLAAIEAGLLGVPIVCFEKASGIQELVKQGGGEVVPYLDIQRMADAIIKLVTSDELRAKYGLEVKQLFQQCKPAIISRELEQVLTQILESRE